jgi:hypothetical protein
VRVNLDHCPRPWSSPPLNPRPAPIFMLNSHGHFHFLFLGLVVNALEAVQSLFTFCSIPNSRWPGVAIENYIFLEAGLCHSLIRPLNKISRIGSKTLDSNVSRTYHTTLPYLIDTFPIAFCVALVVLSNTILLQAASQDASHSRLDGIIASLDHHNPSQWPLVGRENGFNCAKWLLRWSSRIRSR